ncbi:MAG: alanine--tRNA ligase [Lachnospiraceae bacterium]|nr:MAG: alanine--tRNA ligase [Lachnospiraceae bacterium]
MSHNNYGVNEIRKKFLDFFASKDHLILKSFSLVPHNDNSLLLINSGMAPMKPYFTGQEIPPRKRVATCQKCIRTGDIENVGKTARHGTFFEMLGNFSFGDYFKKEAIHWTWEFLTEVIGLSPDRLYPSVYVDDAEAFAIWRDEIGIDEKRIYKFGKGDNFWEHGAGPCGPCSEVYYDRGEKYGCHKDGCEVGCDCDRYMEVWNNVFTQFNNDGKGNYSELEQKNIDTGMGLERLAVVVQDVYSIFEIDTIKSLLDKVAKIAGTKYKEDEQKDISLRLITDHIRSCTFMISDGIMPSNEGRGYVLRKLLRRAARHGRLLGIESKFLAELSGFVIASMKEGYPELEEKKAMILKVLTEEEDKFYKTINQGLQILAEIEADMSKSGTKLMSGEDAFKLYDTYGFPLDLTKEILEEKGLSVDEEGFAKAMAEQKRKAKEARKTTNYMGADVTVYQSVPTDIVTKFLGYTELEAKSKVLVLTTQSDLVESLTEDMGGSIITGQSPFYAAMGGQCGDIGTISSATGTFVVEDTIKLQGDKQAHVGYVESGYISVNDEVDMKVDESYRSDTCKNHSATHLLHAALRAVLGKHVEQAGSLVSNNRLRFDFTHFAALTKEELKKIEDTVNQNIRKALNVNTDLMNLEAARKSGAMALFGEKYKDDVRVVSMGDESKELCGGTHVKNTAEIKTFKIISETGIAAGVRRIEALTGENVLHFYEKLEDEVYKAAAELKTTPDKLHEKIKHLIEEVKDLKSEQEKLKAKLAKDSISDIDSQIYEVGGIKAIVLKVNDVEMNELRNLGDNLKQKVANGVIVLASVSGSNVSLLAMAGDDAVSKGIHAGNIIKSIATIVGGGGGGRPNMAQAGGKRAEDTDKALEEAKKVIAAQLA